MPKAKLWKQLDLLEAMLCLRPYDIDMAETNTILQALEARANDSFTMADLIAFAEGAEAFAISKFGSTTEIHTLIGCSFFHKQLAEVWEQMDTDIQSLLSAGIPVSKILIQVEMELATQNKSRCSKPSSFTF